MFLNVTTHHTPAYDFAPNPDKQWILRHTEKMLPIHRSFTDMLMTKRLQTLQSVDSAVEKIVNKLETTGKNAAKHGYFNLTMLITPQASLDIHTSSTLLIMGIILDSLDWLRGKRSPLTLTLTYPSL